MHKVRERGQIKRGMWANCRPLYACRFIITQWEGRGGLFTFTLAVDIPLPSLSLLVLYQHWNDRVVEHTIRSAALLFWGGIANVGGWVILIHLLDFLLFLVIFHSLIANRSPPSPYWYISGTPSHIKLRTYMSLGVNNEMDVKLYNIIDTSNEENGPLYHHHYLDQFLVSHYSKAFI